MTVEIISWSILHGSYVAGLRLILATPELKITNLLHYLGYCATGPSERKRCFNDSNEIALTNLNETSNWIK